MSDRERSHAQFLDLITRPGVIEIVVALHEHNGSATFAQLQAAGVARPSPILRSLAAAGQVRRADSGTWDTDPSPHTTVALTAAGLGLAQSLLKAGDWSRRNLPDPDRPDWRDRTRIRRYR
jgi:DNA-binding HxlR family transcriptional regulator